MHSKDLLLAPDVVLLQSQGQGSGSVPQTLASEQGGAGDSSHQSFGAEGSDSPTGDPHEKDTCEAECAQEECDTPAGDSQRTVMQQPRLDSTESLDMREDESDNVQVPSDAHKDPKTLLAQRLYLHRRRSVQKGVADTAPPTSSLHCPDTGSGHPPLGCDRVAPTMQASHATATPHISSRPGQGLSTSVSQVRMSPIPSRMTHLLPHTIACTHAVT